MTHRPCGRQCLHRRPLRWGRGPLSSPDPARRARSPGRRTPKGAPRLRHAVGSSRLGGRRQPLRHGVSSRRATASNPATATTAGARTLRHLVGSNTPWGLWRGPVATGCGLRNPRVPTVWVGLSPGSHLARWTLPQSLRGNRKWRTGVASRHCALPALTVPRLRTSPVPARAVSQRLGLWLVDRRAVVGVGA